MKKIQVKRAVKILSVVMFCVPLLAVLWFVILDSLFPFPEERLYEGQSGGATEVLDREGGLVAWRVDSNDDWRVPVALEQVSPWLVSATVAAEDKRFWSHNGVDVLAACRAVSQNLRHRRRVSGASTITMQSIRLLYPRDRTWGAKTVEAFRALQIERGCCKEDILQLYFNLAPYGGNVIGAEAAARHYFGKAAAELTLGEAAMLAGIPQSPARFNPRKHLSAALKRREFVFDRMLILGLAMEDELKVARKEPILIAGRGGRTVAPRFVDYLLHIRKDSGGIIRTTLDSRTQAIARAVTVRRYRDLHPSGVDGMAVVVIDVKDCSLAAMIGNPEPENFVTGWINGATSLRQPGSLLKPFIFGVAYGKGILTPDSVVYDIPSGWGGYRPNNMDHDFMGPISASGALRFSRNIPAVALLDRIGENTLFRKISEMGLRTVAGTDRYGLSLALGTAEMRLVDLANAYAALARMGQYEELQMFAGIRQTQGKQVFSPEVAWLILRSLGAASSGEKCRCVWKTGTSWNRRDAWAIALTPRNVVAVWCGCLAGEGNPRLSGMEAALPVALELMEKLEHVPGKSWVRPEGVKVRKVCALSGKPVGLACRHVKEGEYIPGVSDDTPCRIHRLICRGGRNEPVVEWPKEVVSFMDNLGEKNGGTATNQKSLSIVSPCEEGEYMVSDAGGCFSRIMEFVSNAGVGSKVYWYLDGNFVGTSVGSDPFRWEMRVGQHELAVADDGEESSSVKFSVRLLGRTLFADD